jgi:hypothetical protein
MEEFPKYLMKINGQRKFLSLRDAYVAYDSGFDKVKFGIYVLEKDFSVRKMTEEDAEKISNFADKHSESK